MGTVDAQVVETNASIDAAGYDETAFERTAE
jgi:hypothetical protein